MLLSSLEVIRLRASPKTTILVIRLSTDDGRTGLGEGSAAGSDVAVAAAASELFQAALAGRRVESIARLLEELRVHTGPTPGIARATAASALEQGLWDLRGQQVDLPVWALLGGMRRERVPLYANINRGLSDRSPEAFADRARQAAAAGFGAVKCAPFDGVRPEAIHETGTRRAIDLGIERVDAVRRAIGGDLQLMVDCHGRFDRETAIEVAHRLADFKLLWLEEPLSTHPDMHVLASVTEGEPGSRYEAPDRAYGGLRDVATASPIPLAGGEFFFGLAQFEDVLQTGALRYLMPDVKHCGGLWEALRIGTLAEAHGVALAPHNPSGAVATLASAHLGVSLVAFDRLEFQWLEVPWRAELLDPPEQIAAGTLLLPAGPGLGARLNERTVAAHRIPLHE